MGSGPSPSAKRSTLAVVTAMWERRNAYGYNRLAKVEAAIGRWKQVIR
jgi:hypothetical protein